MTLTEQKQKWKKWLLNEVGYHEVGENGTKYALEYDYDTRMYGFDMYGLPWCDWFSDLSYMAVFGYETGAKMTYQYPSGSAACSASASFYRANNAWYSTPEVGDQVFFYYSGDINHVECVIEVNGSSFTTVGGNSSDMVKKNYYTLGDSCIAGFGRPKWSLTLDVADTEEETIEEASSEETTEDIVPGDIVRVKDGAVWYTGANIPSWVFDKEWVVLSRYNDRVVLNKSTDGSMSIMSPIDVQYLTKVSSGEAEKQEDPIFTESTSSDDEPHWEYEVKRGDSLWAIAARYLDDGSRYPEIIELNNLSSSGLIYPGQVIKIPDK